MNCRVVQLWCVLVCLLTSGLATSVLGQQDPEKFLESYALASDRQALLKKLTPGTDRYYFFHALYFQTLGRTEESQKIIDEWVSKDQTSIYELQSALRIRQAMLNYKHDPAGSLAIIRELLWIPEISADRGNQADYIPPTSDQSFLDVEKLIREEVEKVKLDGIEDSSLLEVLPLLNHPMSLGKWIERIDRVDVPNLPELISEQLKTQFAIRFGQAKIHQLLTLEQLKRLADLQPSLRDQDAFVKSYLIRLQPPGDTDLFDIAEKRQYFQRLEDYVLTLSSKYAALQATVLYHRLRLDQHEGAYDRERFTRYLKLPRNAIYYRVTTDGAYASSGIANNFVDLDFHAAKYIPDMQPIHDDRELVNDYLTHFLRTDESPDPFRTWIRDEYLDKLFAETKILHGVGDPSIHYSNLANEDQESVRHRSELRLAPTNRAIHRVDEEVKLELWLKNVSKLEVKVFRLDGASVVRDLGSISTDIELEGLIPSFQKTISYDELSDRRHQKTITMKELTGRGVWVVDFFGCGLRSRALIQKGELRTIKQTDAGGQILRIQNETGEIEREGYVEIGKQRYRSDAEGNILIPYSAEHKAEKMLVATKHLATMEPFDRSRPKFEFRADFLLDTGSLVAGREATLLVRPMLLCNGYPLPLAKLKNTKLKVLLNDIDGVGSEDMVRIAVTEEELVSYRFKVPARLREIQFQLMGDYEGSFERRSVIAGYDVKVNGFEKTGSVVKFYLQPSVNGYSLYLLGRNGEAYPNQRLHLGIKVRGLVDKVNRAVVTDPSGCVELGLLPRVESITANTNGATEETFSLLPIQSVWPKEVIKAVGDTVWFASEPEDKRYSLVELRGNAPYADHSGLIQAKAGAIAIDGLPRGAFLLRDHFRSVQTTIHVVDGQDLGDRWQCPTKVVGKQPYMPSYVESLAKKDGKWILKLHNNDAKTRVHVIGRIFHNSSAYGRLSPPSVRKVNVWARVAPLSLYVSDRAQGEEQQYVMARAKQGHLPGNLLAPPSWLLSPWDYMETDYYGSDLKEGDEMPDQELPQSEEAIAEADTDEDDEFNPEDADLGNDYFHFLREGAWVKSNLKADENGIVILAGEELEGKSQIQVVVTHPTAVTYFTSPLEKVDVAGLSKTDQRLGARFPDNEHRLEKRVIERLRGGEWNEIGEEGHTRFTVMRELRDLYSYYSKTCNGSDSDWNLFRPITDWPSYNFEEKCRLYERLAGHEIHLFLYYKDREFFDQVVQPYLKNKLEKKFLDQWLLNEDLSKFSESWRLEILNPFELVLLYQRVPALRETIENKMRRRMDDENQFRNLRRKFFAVAMANAVDSEMPGNLSLIVSAGAKWNELDKEKGVWSPGGGMGGMMGMGEFMPVERNARVSEDLLSLENEDDGDPFAEDTQKVDEENENAMQNELRDELEAYLEGGYVRRMEHFYPLKRWKVSPSYLWRESYYYRPDFAWNVRFTKFWGDWLTHSKTGGAFLSSHLDWGPFDLTTALVALAILDLPWENKVEWKTENGKIYIRPEHNCIAFVQRTEAVEKQNQDLSIGIAQQVTEYRVKSSDQDVDVAVSRFVRGVPYQCQIVVMNPTDKSMPLDVLVQIPQGAIPLNGGEVTRSWYAIIPAYDRVKVKFEFYFPEAGDFEQYGVQVGDTKGIVASLPPRSYRVNQEGKFDNPVTELEILEFGSDEQVLELLRQDEKSKISSGLFAERLRQRSFYDRVVELYSDRGEFNFSLWSFALLHGDEKRMKEWFANNHGLCEQIGPVFKSDMLSIDPTDRQMFEHFEFFPMITTRRHSIGNGIVHESDDARDAYLSLLQLLCYREKLEPTDKLQLVSYLLLQNRIEEALKFFSEVPRESVTMKLQYDYCDAYLAMYKRDYARARSVAVQYKDYTLPRWKNLFGDLVKQLDDRDALLAGRRTGIDPTAVASMELVQDSLGLHLYHNQLGTVTVRYFQMDIEALFSRQPFEQHTGASLAWGEPSSSEVIDLESAKEPLLIELPESLQNTNVLVQVSSEQNVVSRMVYSNQLKVVAGKENGILQVLHRDTREPLDATYIKVFGRDAFGKVEFYKDGYTDLKGEFDYLRQTKRSLSGLTEFAILIVHPKYGTRVIEL